MTHSFLLIGEHNVAMEGLHHKECLTEGTRAFPQYLVWLHGDDGAQGKDEGVDILHVQVVGCHGVRDRVVGKTLDGSTRTSIVCVCTNIWMYGHSLS